jgi:TetR/AcrR family transcriptional regulator, tetracycline repressor protein
VLRRRPQPRRRGRPPRAQQPLSRDRVLRAALALLDSRGLASVSVRQLASRLGVTPMALYNHFASKDDLLDALHEAVLLDVVRSGPRRGASWKSRVTTLAGDLRQALRAHPHALLLFATRPVRALAILKIADELLRRLLAAGFSARQALFLFDCVVMLTTGHALAEFGISPAAAPERSGRDLAAQRAALSRAGLHCLVHVVEKTTPHDYDAEFESGLRALLDGFALQLRRR